MKEIVSNLTQKQKILLIIISIAIFIFLFIYIYKNLYESENNSEIILNNDINQIQNEQVNEKI